MVPSPLAEHAILLASTFLFPPVAMVVVVVVLLATLGKSLGLRERYVATLIWIFEWGARQIKTTAKLKRAESHAPLDIDIESSEEEEEEEMDEDETERSTARSDGYESSSLGRQRRNSANSVSSRASSVCSLRRRHGSGNNIIRRDTQLNLEDDDDDLCREILPVTSRGWAVIGDSNGIEAIIEDEVTSRFEAEQLMTWNMLTRTSTRFFQFVNWKLTALYMAGFIFRYACLLPMRVTLFIIGLVFMLVSTAIVGVFPDGALKKALNHKAMLTCHRILSRSISAVVYFHDEQYKSSSHGIAVANHTSPMDVMVLSTDNVYALIGQSHGGLLGLMQRALSRASAHIWFDRSEAKDRSAVSKLLKEHVSDPDKLPILIFPEGTCINNTSVMMFKKGSFEVGATIYPIAMKYDSRFGDPFWNSSEQSWGEYILRMMTSWAIICHVWYLPPMTRLEDEEAVDFANRVKKVIAARGGLVDLEWDGMLKRCKVPPKLVAKQQEKFVITSFLTCQQLQTFTLCTFGSIYANRLSRYTSTCERSVPGTGGGAMNGDDAEDEGIASSPPISGYASLEELPEAEVVTDEEDNERPIPRSRSRPASHVVEPGH
ncbi:acl-4 [Pristionchus pacificus]|uniref:Acl-4 n=1 Tax=Pristionchus pacificus TaxID=54126 RepID=A0A2A6C6P5_PRIPA|nr:acl-4 [Pristionchus pacificus]|eukprot:PDM73844.1 acl-4 [Pristionchus pacificus]